MNRLKQLRVSKGLSQQSVADELQITQQAYANYEAGKRTPDVQNLSKLANFFNTSIDYILGNTDDPTPPDAKKESPGFLTPEDVMKAAENQKGRPLTAEERAELLIRFNDLKASILRIQQNGE